LSQAGQKHMQSIPCVPRIKKKIQMPALKFQLFELEWIKLFCEFWFWKLRLFGWKEIVSMNFGKECEMPWRFRI